MLRTQAFTPITPTRTCSTRAWTTQANTGDTINLIPADNLKDFGIPRTAAD